MGVWHLRRRQVVIVVTNVSFGGGRGDYNVLAPQLDLDVSSRLQVLRHVVLCVHAAAVEWLGWRTYWYAVGS